MGMLAASSLTVRAMAAEGMYRSCSGQDLTAVSDTLRDKVFFSCPHRNSFVIDD